MIAIGVQRLLPQPPGPAVVDAPGGQVFRPAVAALDLDFEQSESGRGGEQEKNEDCMLHGEVDAVRRARAQSAAGANSDRVRSRL